MSERGARAGLGTNGRARRELRPVGAEALTCTSETLSALAGDIVVVRLVGEVDLRTQSELDAALDAHLDQRAPRLVVDLAGLRFCSARGMAILVQAGATAAEHGIRYALSGAPGWLDRMWAKLWTEAELPARYPSLDAAVTALHVAGTARPV